MLFVVVESTNWLFHIAAANSLPYENTFEMPLRTALADMRIGFFVLGGFAYVRWSIARSQRHFASIFVGGTIRS